MKSWAKWTAKTVLVMTGFAAAGGGFAGAAFAGTSGIHPGNVSVLSGSKIKTPAGIPIGICRTAAAFLGIATAGCQGGGSVAGRSGSWYGRWLPGSPPGHDARIPVSVPAGVCGNAAAVLGDAAAWCVGGATALSSVQKSEGMSGSSLVTLAIGALLASAAAVRPPSRRPRTRTAGAAEVPA